MQNKAGNNVRPGGGKSSTASDFILSTYNPRIAVISTPAADAIASRNNLTIGQLLAPFSRLQTDVLWHEPVNSQIIAPRNLRITPVSLQSWKRVDTDSPANRKFLADTVARNTPPITPFSNSELWDNGKFNLQTPDIIVQDSVPWFIKWREQFLRLQAETANSVHEYLYHFMACVMVMSAEDGKTADQLSSTVGNLSKLQQQNQIEWGNNWTFPSVLKFYLILHDSATADKESADTMYQNLRTTYGGNFCFMVNLSENSGANTENSLCNALWPQDSFDRPVEISPDDSEELLFSNDSVISSDPSDVMHPLSPNCEMLPVISQNGDNHNIPHNPPIIARGQNFTPEDLKSLQSAINEFISKALLPYIERQSRILHESIVNRRGMSKSFFSATKRLFGTSKTASSIVYANESLEMMSRKLADIYFLFGHYGGAYHLYHQLKKDFAADSAWSYFASSLEMAAVSHFMMSQVEPPLAMARAFPAHYITDAINYYLDNCRMTDAAMKCALICCECLKQMDNYGEAAAIYIRMTSEDCDLRSALMLEQAAYAIVRVKYPRKYALHCVLAGHRYSKAGMKTHSLHCYLQAAQIYAGRGWRFAEDHVHFTIARHEYLLQLTQDISPHLQSLLITPSPQPVHQIQLFYKEYLTTMAKLGKADNPTEFFIPKIVCSDICVRIAVSNLHVGEIKSHNGQNSDPQNSWDSLEEHVLKECVDGSVMIFKPSRMIYDSTSDNTVNPTVPCNETFYVEVPIMNPLSIPLALRKMQLIYSNPDSIESNLVPELDLQPSETKVIRFGVRPLSQGLNSLEWLRYELDSSPFIVPFKQRIVLQGPRLSSTKAERGGRIYAKDFRNKVNVVEKMPLLQASIQSVPSTLFHCQTTEFQIVLHDKSSDSNQLNRIQEFVIAMDNMKNVVNILPEKESDDVNGLKINSVRPKYARLQASFNESTHSCQIPCCLKAPATGEFLTLKLLILYKFNNSSNETETKSKSHRIMKISIKLPLVSCLKLEYSTLKLLNAKTHIGLLRTNNLTPDGQIAIQQIQYLDDKFQIEELNATNVIKGFDEDGNCVSLSPMECRNVILKVVAGDFQSIISTPKNQLELEVRWKLTKPQREDSREIEATGVSRVLVEDLRNILSLEENAFIFELNHDGRCQNDFNTNPCLFFNIELQVHSRVGGCFTLQFDRNHLPSTIGGPGMKTSGDEISFVGQTTWTIDVTPNNTSTLNYTVAIGQPGVFNVAPAISILSANENSTSTRKYVLHSPVIVAHSNSS